MRPLTLHTVLVATDLSDDDLSALQTAFALAQLAGADLHVVHAADSASSDVASQLDRHIRAADPDRTRRPGTTVHQGPAHRVIVDAAETVDADVIVLGPHHPDRSRAEGGTAYRVAASAGRPCLVLPSPLRLPLGRILVPVDESGAARGALSIALTWASALRRRASRESPAATSLVVMNVRGPEQGATTSEEVMSQALAAVDEPTTNASGVNVQRTAAAGPDAATMILEQSVTGDFDLIVLGTRAESTAEAALGSVSSAIVRAASRPVLLVPPRVWRDSAGE